MLVPITVALSSIVRSAVRTARVLPPHKHYSCTHSSCPIESTLSVATMNRNTTTRADRPHRPHEGDEGALAPRTRQTGSGAILFKVAWR